jgi:PhnB protein
MPSRLNPYLAFPGNARQAMEFYQSVFGGKLDINLYKDSGMSQDPSEGEKIMHALLETENGFALMASDTPQSHTRVYGNNVSISLSGDNSEELTSYWEKLSQGATILEPLVTAPWGDTFGMLKDQFGIEWMVNISGKKE